MIVKKKQKIIIKTHLATNDSFTNDRNKYKRKKLKIMWKLYLIIGICIFTLFNLNRIQKWINNKVKKM